MYYRKYVYFKYGMYENYSQLMIIIVCTLPTNKSYVEHDEIFQSTLP